MQGSLCIVPGRARAAYVKAVKRGSAADAVRRIMRRDASLFSKRPALRQLIADRLGWVDSAGKMKARLRDIEEFGNSVLAAGYKHVVLIGMGGSSLCPDLFRLVYRHHPSLKSFQVIDSTDPEAIRAIARAIEPRRTLFIVASKSGSTVETRSHEAYFQGLLKEAGVRVIGRHFCAITDAGSELHRSARHLKYRKVFLNPADIGGRYSALSYFGLVPAFFAGVDLKALVDDAVMMQSVLSERAGETNPALLVAALMTAAAESGGDKLTFVASKKTAPLVPWIEQLIAESTGKNGHGIIPIENEPPGRPLDFGNDRCFVFLRRHGEKTVEAERLKDAVVGRKYPVIDITLGSFAELGRQFLLWEAATAVSGWLLGVNPFDEPNVTESKNNTRSILAGFERAGAFPDLGGHGRWGALSLIAYGGPRNCRAGDRDDLNRLLRRLYAGAKPPRYAAVLNYFRADRSTEKSLSAIRATLRRCTGMATLRGYGPRYLHSIGQLYKGGPARGLFVVLVRAKYRRLPIPGRIFDFGQLIAAQAIGDAQALIKRDLPTLVLAIEGPVGEGLAQLQRALEKALQ